MTLLDASVSRSFDAVSGGCHGSGEERVEVLSFRRSRDRVASPPQRQHEARGQLKIILFVLSTVLSGVSATAATRQNPGDPVSSVARLLEQSSIGNTEWETRRDLFAELIGIDPAEYSRTGIAFVRPALDNALSSDTAEVAKARVFALVELLEIENDFVGRNQTLPEDFVNYHGDLIGAVSSANDPRALNALLGAIKSGGMVRDALVGLGPNAVAPTAEMLNSEDVQVRYSAVAVLVDMLSNNDISSDAVAFARIREALMRAATDRNPFVRRNSIPGLVLLGDPESIGLLQEMATSDPFQAEYREGNPFVVRDEAAAALDGLPGRD